ncbi:MAG: ParB/RepB/Spo0J family partition protein [Betaproteobacteria bacterium]|nr:ParB/RepB/Spo0J family partition protein [Betaproteobacteria bacterium]
MATHATGLGRGLDALIRETQDHPEGGGVRMLPLCDILPNPRQPRRNFNEKPLEELAASIRSQGLLQPLLVRPIGAAQPGKYEIVAGERRWRACQMVGLTEVPVLVRTFSAQDTLAAALIENIQREDLNPIEEAQGLQILKEEFGLSQDDLAQKLGKSRSSVANSLRLLTLPESIRPLLAEGKLSAGHARALLSVADARAQEHLKNLILENKLSVREAEGLAAGWKETGRFELSGFNDKREGVAPALEQESGNEDDAEGRLLASPARKSKPQSARILEIQNRIGDLYKVPVRVTGKESKGKISFSYGTKEELDTLLKRLSQPALDGESHVALGSTAHEALDGKHMDSLEGADFPALDGARTIALKHAERAALDGSKIEALSASPSLEALAESSDSQADPEK